MEEKRQNIVMDFICKECSETKGSWFILSLKSKICKDCREKLFPKHLPEVQFEKYWIDKCKHLPEVQWKI